MASMFFVYLERNVVQTISHSLGNAACALTLVSVKCSGGTPSADNGAIAAICLRPRYYFLYFFSSFPPSIVPFSSKYLTSSSSSFTTGSFLKARLTSSSRLTYSLSCFPGNIGGLFSR